MTTAPTAGVGWTLARLAALNPRRALRNTGEATGATREQIAELLRTNDRPMLIDDLCAATGLHANTIRGHLDVLVASGEVSRSRAPAAGRGRPPWLYSAADQEHSLADDLKVVLDDQLAVHDETDRAFIADAAQRWAEAMGADFSPRDVTTPAEAVDAAAEALTAVGFSAEVSPLGDSIALRTCPYASLVADHPVICDIHTALLSNLLDNTGQDVEVEQMQVWATPTACLVHLRRPDMTPDRVITPSPATPDDTPRKSRKPKRRKSTK